MASRPDWNNLDHAQRLKVLRDTSVDQIVKDYTSDDVDPPAFRARLMRERTLWQPEQADGTAKEAGSPPNKEVILGAWRDLDRSEALHELIDNSIDAWNRRRVRHPGKSAPELNIYIDIDADTGQLTYDDNAGGVSTENLENLVVPGHSETDALAHSIGSYKTGGKKAIFRLATAVNITTRFWNPAETGDSAVSVHLDDRWLTDVNQYTFPYYELKGGGHLQRGQTQYVMQLRDEPLGAPWYRNSSDTDKIRREIQRTYSLLMARSRVVNIHFPKRGLKIEPALNSLYDFSGKSDTTVDIRPQRVAFKTSIEYLGREHPLTIEVMIGCRATSGYGDAGPGFDLYGNDRLFVFRDRRLFQDVLPTSGATNLILGWLNIIGPNVFVPWDTHKRHLNYDRDVIDIIRNHPAVRELFKNWNEAYNRIGRIEVKKTIGVPYKLEVDKSGQIDVPHSSEVALDATKKRGPGLPAAVFKPVVPTTKKTTKENGVSLSMTLTSAQARQLSSVFKVAGPLEAAQTKRALTDKVKDHLLGLIKKGRPKKA